MVVCNVNCQNTNNRVARDDMVKARRPAKFSLTEERKKIIKDPKKGSIIIGFLNE
jgi:hypothetical protein